MRKIIAMFLCICLVLNIGLVTAFAAELDESTEGLTNVAATSESPQDLAYVEDLFFIDSYKQIVTADKNWTLRIWIDTSDTCKIQVYKGASILASKTVTVSAGATDIELVSRCDNSNYTIKLTNNTGVVVSYLVYETPNQ